MMFRFLVVAAVIACNTLVVATSPPITDAPISSSPVAPTVTAAPIIPPTDPPTNPPTSAPTTKNKMMMKDDEKPGMKRRV